MRGAGVGPIAVPQRRLGDLAPTVVLGVGAAALLFFVGYPLLWLLLGAIGLPRTATLQYLARTVTRPANLTPLLNTLWLAAASGLGAAVLGVPLAWAVARSDLRLRGLVHALVGFAYVLPPYLTSVAYIILLGPNAGYLNRLLAWAFGLPRGPFSIFSGAGVTLVITLHVLAFPYFLTHAALRSVDASLEESARLLGAGRWAVLRRVTLPLAAPAITGGALLAAVDSLALFGPQAILGMPAQLVFLPTRIFGGLTAYPPRFAEASALSLALVILSVAGLTVQRRFLDRRSYVTVGGRGVAPAIWRLGRLRWPLTVLALLVVGFASLAPFGVLAVAAFSKVWTTAPVPSNLTLANFAAALFHNQIAARGVRNSFALAVSAATLAVAVGLAVAYLDLRTALRGRRLLDYLAILPLGLPGTVFAVALIQAFLRPPLILYGTIWILLVAYVGRSVPLATRSANAALRQVDASLEEAARIAGASWLASIRLVLLPIVRSTLLTGWLLVFIPALGELSATILLYTSGTETISVAIYRLNDLGQLEVVAALAVFLAVVILAASVLVQWLAGRGRLGAVAEGAG